MRRSLAVAALLLTGFLAGCSAPAGGAQDAYDLAASQARAWASDARLVGLAGIEATANATADLLEGVPDQQAPASLDDGHLGDGLAPYWVAVFVSQDKAGSAIYVVADGEVRTAATGADMPMGFPAGGATPDLDSVDVIAAIAAANATHGALLDGPGLEHVLYAFDAEEDTWAVSVELADGRELLASVADATSEVTRSALTVLPPVAQPAKAIYDNVTVTNAYDPLNFVGLPPCSTPSAACVEYPFVLEEKTAIRASLAWGSPVSDFDFYVYQGDAQVLSGASDVTGGPGTSEAIDDVLPAGEYTLVVVPWSVVSDEYHLVAMFQSA